MRRAGAPAVLALLAAGVAAGFPSTARAQESTGSANRQFVQAMQLIQQANATFDPAEEARLLRDADRLLNEIVQRYPESPVAVQLITNQFIGDFDVFEFRNRVRALICNEALSTACFLYKIENLLPPIEHPISTPRWDWLSLAVAYHLNGGAERAREIIAPFVGALRRGAATSAESQEEDLFVARALALNPKLIIADEAVSALDVSIQAQVIDLLADLRTRLGLSYIFITHDLPIVRHFADRIIVMKHGEIVEQGATQALFSNPQHPYTRTLLNATPHPKWETGAAVGAAALPDRQALR